MCLCSKCLNPHCLYKAIKSTIDTDLPASLSHYLCKNMNCKREPETDFHSRTCILSQCDKNCKIVNISADLAKVLPKAKTKKVHYYVFETVDTQYYNNRGKLVSYSRTARVDKHDFVENIIEQLQLLAQKYILHRFFVINDKVYWKKFLQSTEYHTLWLDYSQNIAFTEKKQVQSAHFSGKQHTLHNTVIQSPNQGKIVYVHHLSDDTNHDSVLTFSIIRDIIKHHPEVIQKGFLIIRSDNCQEQYKCKFTFFEMKRIAIEFGITVVWFYGELGHGRGLVDAMSSFGCKLQLRHEIITNDSWFPNAKHMVQFLKKYFSGDNSKEYYCVDDADTAQLRTKERGEFVLTPCRQFHVIAVNQNGEFKKVLYFREQDIVSTLYSGDIIYDEEIDHDDKDDEQAFRLNQDTIFELIDPGTYVGIRSPPNAIEPFYIVEVFSKGIAKEALSDTNGHSINSGEQYAEVGYLQKQSEKKGDVQYQRPRKRQSIFIHMAEVFVTNVALNEDLCMDLYEYQSIFHAAL